MNVRRSRPRVRGSARPAAQRSLLHILLREHLKLWVALAVASLVYLLSPAGWSAMARALASWNAGVLVIVSLVYVWMRRWDSKKMRERYEAEDPTAPVILLVVVAAALLSVIAIVALLSTVKQVGSAERAQHVVLATLTLIGSWLIVPTMYTLHYADLFYSAERDKPPLIFPNTPEPLFWDFVYFSFTIAVACQTADVATTGTGVRKAVLVHSIISFFFNLSVLGFAINVSAGLLGN